MQLGVPVIATAFGGAADFVTVDTAIVVPHSLVSAPLSGHNWAQVDPKALSNAMREAFRDRATLRAVGIRGQEFVKSRFAPHVVAELMFGRLSAALDQIDVRLETMKDDCALFGSILRPFECGLSLIR